MVFAFLKQPRELLTSHPPPSGEGALARSDRPPQFAYRRLFSKEAPTPPLDLLRNPIG
jgi:hypothetical protein